MVMIWIDSVGHMHLRLPLPTVHGRADDQQAEAASRRSLTARLSAATALRVRVPGRAFAAITVAPALLAVAWLLPGTGMLLAGRLRAVPMVIVFAPLAVALCYFAIGRLPARWPRFSEPEPEAARAGARPKADAPAVALLAMLAIAAGFGVWQAFLRSEQVFVTSDPGVYLQYGYWIAEHGTARIPESASAFGGARGWTSRPRGSPCRAARSRRRSCPGCRWSSRAARGFAG